MAYDGFLIKIGSWKVPFRLIQGETYDVSSNREALKEFTDYANERHIVYSKKLKTVVSFETPRNQYYELTDADLDLIREALNNAQLSQTPNIYGITYYDPRTGKTEFKSCTLDDLKITCWGANEHGLKYAPIKFTFREVSSDDF